MSLKTANLCNPNPFLNDSGSLCDRRRRSKQRSDDPVSDCIELSDGGPNSRWKFLVLIPLRPHTAQTLERDHLHKQVLQHQEHQHYKSIWSWGVKQKQTINTGTHSVHSCELFCNIRNGETREICPVIRLVVSRLRIQSWFFNWTTCHNICMCKRQTNHGYTESRG